MDAEGGDDDPLEVEGGAVSSTVTVLHYRPIALGAARLPVYLQDEIMVPLFSKQAFVNQVWRGAECYEPWMQKATLTPHLFAIQVWNAVNTIPN